MHVYFYFPMDLPSRLAHPRIQLHKISSLVHFYSFKLLELSSIIYFSKIFALQKIVILCVNNRMLHVKQKYIRAIYTRKNKMRLPLDAS